MQKLRQHTHKHTATYKPTLESSKWVQLRSSARAVKKGPRMSTSHRRKCVQVRQLATRLEAMGAARQ